MNDPVLVTGGTGFVGRQVVRSLLQRKVAVRAVVRAGSETRLEQLGALEGVVTTPDLFAEDAEWWRTACAGAAAVIHLAWYAEPGRYLQAPQNLDCLAGTLQLAKGAAAAGVRRFVGIGTCFEYDLTAGLLPVTTPLRPLSSYAAAKAAAFLALSQWLPAQQVQFAWCRLFYLYGEGEDPRRLVPYLRAKLAAGEPAELTRGDQVRDFLDVTQAGRLIADTALSQAPGPVNICSGEAITVRQLAERIADEYGRRDLLQFGVRPDNLVDPPRVVGVR
ncbi:MAG TPA: NAD(P)-dependent oxidoreductase [Ramlibacter sp.]|nr:NAD(P)-dependent oxidoreductase [Ramlibacter sp.]